MANSQLDVASVSDDDSDDPDDSDDSGDFDDSDDAVDSGDVVDANTLNTPPAFIRLSSAVSINSPSLPLTKVAL